MEHVVIRKIGSESVEQLQEIGKQTFLEAFGAVNTEENMRKYLRDRFSIESLNAEVDHPESEFYFAELKGEVIGYLKLNFGDAQTELKDRAAVEIERIYVRNAFLGRNVGQLLYRQALSVAKERGARYIWLGVWEENPRALAFYRKNGFVAFDQHIYKLGDDAQTDILMKRTLMS